MRIRISARGCACADGGRSPEPTSVIWHYYEFGKAKINYYYMERNRYVLVFSYYRPDTFYTMPMLLVMDIGVCSP